jgi:hypothetical protein
VISATQVFTTNNQPLQAIRPGMDFKIRFIGEDTHFNQGTKYFLSGILVLSVLGLENPQSAVLSVRVPDATPPGPVDLVAITETSGGYEVAKAKTASVLQVVK